MNKTKAKGKLTGKHALIMILSFFGVIFSMNFTMAYLAFNTFSGLDTQNAYHKGRLFNSEFAVADQQAKDAWNVELHYQLTSEKKILIQAHPKDKTGASLDNLDVRVKLRRPTQAHLDQKAVLKGNHAGLYQATLALPSKGRWDIILTAYKNDKEHFRSVQRVVACYPKISPYSADKHFLPASQQSQTGCP